MKRLPRLILLVSELPHRSEARRLAAELSWDATWDARALALRDPIQEGVRGLFFGGSPDIGIDEGTAIPIISQTFGAVSASLTSWLMKNYNPDILGRILWREIEENKDFFQTFVVDDCTPQDVDTIRYLLKQVHFNEVLVVWVGPPSPLLKVMSVPCLEVAPDAHPADIETALNQLSSAKEPTP